MLYKVGPSDTSSDRDSIISREATQQSGARSHWLQDAAEEDLGAFAMPMLASILRTAVEIGAATGSGSDSDSSRAPFAGHRALAHLQPAEEREVCSHRHESGLDLSRLSLSEGAWVRQMNWAVMLPYWRHQRTGETQWDEEPEKPSLQSRSSLFRRRRRPGTGRGDGYGKRGGSLPLQRAIAKHNSTAVMRSRPTRVA